MKKLLSVILCFSLICSLAACGASEASVADTSVTEESIESVIEESSDPASSAAVVVKSDNAETGEEAVPEEPFEEIILLDNEYCSVILKNIDEGGLWGYTWTVYLENKTDLNLMFSMDSVSVNGYDSDPYWGALVNAGMKSNEEISWTEDFEALGIDAITQVSFRLSVNDSDDWFADPLVEETLTVYPLGEDVVGELFTREAAATDITILDDENCSIILTEVDENAEWGYNWTLYIENKTDQNITVSMDNVSINDLICDPYWGQTVSAGSKTFSNVEWYQDTLDEYGIESVTAVEFDLYVYDADDWMAEEMYDDTLCIYPLGEDAVSLYTREGAASDIVLIDNDVCTVIITGFDPDGDWGYTMDMYLVNKADYDLNFSVDEAAVNGFMCDPYWGQSVPAGKQAFSEASWSSESFELNGIETVEELTLPFTVHEYDSWEEIFSETFTVYP